MPRTPSRRSLTMCVALMVALGAIASGQERPPSLEERIRATYLVKFPEYVTWPRGRLEGKTPFTLCVVAEPPFVRAVEDLLDNQRIDGRPVVLRHPATPAAARECQLLYVSRVELFDSQEMLASVETTGVLLVSDAPDFLRQGGMIQFVLEDNKVRFDINRPAAKRGGLTISARLLRVARYVDGGAVSR